MEQKKVVQNGNVTDIEEIKVVDAKVVKKQGVSISYTLKSQAENVRKLLEAGLVTDEEKIQWMALQEIVTKRWMQKEFGI